MVNGMEADGVDVNQLAQMKQMEEMKKAALTKILTKEAYERLSRVRSVNPMLANQVDLYVFQVYQSGRASEPIDDDKLKEILKLFSEKKEINIKRK